MTKYKMIYVIVDQDGRGEAVASTLTQARRQIAWLLPKGKKYSIKEVLTPSHE